MSHSAAYFSALNSLLSLPFYHFEYILCWPLWDYPWNRTLKYASAHCSYLELTLLIYIACVRAEKWCGVEGGGSYFESQNWLALNLYILKIIILNLVDLSPSLLSSVQCYLLVFLQSSFFRSRPPPLSLSFALRTLKGSCLSQLFHLALLEAHSPLIGSLAHPHCHSFTQSTLSTVLCVRTIRSLLFVYKLKFHVFFYGWIHKRKVILQK